MTTVESAESSPLFRRIAKAILVAVWLGAMLAAMAMTFEVMLAKAGDDAPAWLLAANVVVGWMCDLWVGFGPVVLLSAARWGAPRSFLAVGWFVLALALAVTLTNKIDFWGARADMRVAQAELQEAAANVDPLAEQRRLVRENPDVRLASVVEAELAGVRAQIQGLDAVRYRTVLFGLRQRETELAAEAALARAVRDAKAALSAEAAARIGAAAPSTPEAAPRPVRDTLARDRWIAGVLSALPNVGKVDPRAVGAAMDGLYAVLHELLCLIAFAFGTMAQPPSAYQAEQVSRARRRYARQLAEREVEIELARMQAAAAAAAAGDPPPPPPAPPGARAPAPGPLFDPPAVEPEIVARPSRDAEIEAALAMDRARSTPRVFGMVGDGARMFWREVIPRVFRRDPPKDEPPVWSGKAIGGPTYHELARRRAQREAKTQALHDRLANVQAALNPLGATRAAKRGVLHAELDQILQELCALQAEAAEDARRAGEPVEPDDDGDGMAEPPRSASAA